MIKPFSYLHYSSYEFSCNDEQSFFTFVSAYYLLLFIFSGLCQYRPCETTAFMDYVEKGEAAGLTCITLLCWETLMAAGKSE